MIRRTIRNPARKRFVKESKEVTVFVLEPSEAPYEAMEGWDVNDFHLHDCSKFYAFDEDYAYLCGKVYNPSEIRVPKSCKIYGLEEDGDNVVEVNFDPENEDMVGCLVIEKDSSWSIDDELVSLNDFINGRGIYDVYMFEDVDVNILEDKNIRLIDLMNELNDLGFEGGFERTEYVPSDVKITQIPDCIDWSSYTNGDYVVVFKGKIVINRA